MYMFFSFPPEPPAVVYQAKPGRGEFVEALFLDGGGEFGVGGDEGEAGGI